MEYLPITTGTAAERSRLEAMQRAAGLQPGSVTSYWHGWIRHPLTGQEALVVQSEADKEYFTAAELLTLLSQEQAAAADWFLEFDEEL